MTTTTPTLRAAAQAALDAMQRIYIAPDHTEYIEVWWPACLSAIEGLRAALAQPEPEPVAWLTVENTVLGSTSQWLRFSKPEHCISATPLYAAPPQRKPLTADEVVHLIFENTKINPNQRDDAVLFGYIVNAVRAVERAHGIGE